MQCDDVIAWDRLPWKAERHLRNTFLVYKGTAFSRPGRSQLSHDYVGRRRLAKLIRAYSYAAVEIFRLHLLDKRTVCPNRPSRNEVIGPPLHFNFR